MWQWFTYIYKLQCVIKTESSLQMNPVLGQRLTYISTCVYTKYIQCVIKTKSSLQMSPVLGQWHVCIQNTYNAKCGPWLTYVCVYKIQSVVRFTYMCVYKIQCVVSDWPSTCVYTKYIKCVVSDWPTCVYTKYMYTMCAQWFTYLQNTYNVELKEKTLIN